ncbi:MAG: phytoene desaturase family protein, partial [Acidimicrobiales bacterium]
MGPRGAGVVSALTRVATYAGDLDLVSADAAVSQLQLALEGNVVYLDGGWQSLVDGLVAAAASGGA